MLDAPLRDSRTIVPIDPVTRIEGHLKVSIEVERVNGVPTIVDAWCTGTLFRGIEKILVGRSPEDAPHITQRICGVCPIPHALASVMALESANGQTAPSNARILRNIVLAANFVDSNILHFYHLSLMDYVEGPNQAPWQPSWKVDKRLDQATTDRLVASYVQAIDMRRKAHEFGAVFGGRMPHTPAFLRGGITTVPNAAQIEKVRSLAAELLAWVKGTYLPDVENVCAAYPEYFHIGGGPKNLMSFGVFDQGASGMLFKPGYQKAGTTAPVALNATMIREHVTCSWYEDSSNNLPPSGGVTAPIYPKDGAYSWIKSPRYAGKPTEVGPLARMIVNGDYPLAISVNDRHLARVKETIKILEAIPVWLSQIVVGQPIYTHKTLAATGTGVGMTEAPRGAVGHWVSISGGLLSRYQIVTPTCWNCSPSDSARQKGPLESALIGTPLKNFQEPVEALRVIHSYDPCLGCAVHVVKPKDL